jgi:predicted aminopeptidase
VKPDSSPRRPGRRRLLLTAAALLAVVLFVASVLPGCSAGYVLRQSATHMHVLTARQPVEKARRKGKILPEWEEGLTAIEQARQFGVESLGLPAEDLYKSISLVHPEPMWIVTASPRDALEPVTWWFPVTGRVAYRGYYGKEGAEKFASGLRGKDLDVLIEPSDAFSSLGWFSDPIRPAMLDRSPRSLVNLVLHESAHRVVYLKGETDFNEAFATFSGDEGTLLFFRAREGEACPTCAGLAEAALDAGEFSRFIEAVVVELQTLYQSTVTREEKLLRREEIFTNARERFASLEWRTRGYSGLLDRPLDNAVILSLRRYEGNREPFARLLSHCEGDLRRAIAMLAGMVEDGSFRKAKDAGAWATLEGRLGAGSAPCP